MNPAKKLDDLIRKLDTRRSITWLEEMNVGRPALDRVIDELRKGKLKLHQTCNALYAAFRLRRHGDENEVFGVILRFARDSRIKVRSKAVTLAIGLIRLELPGSPGWATDEDVRQVLRDAAALALEKDAQDLAEDFLAGRLKRLVASDAHER